MASVVVWTVGGPPELVGGVCGGCHAVFFPYQSFGCERCGRYGADLAVRVLTSRGAVQAATVVHLHADPRRAAPFTVVEVRLDDGPVVRAVAADGTAVAAGTRVEAFHLPVAEGEDELLGLRFRPEHAGGAA
jgi:uncharacterized protein